MRRIIVTYLVTFLMASTVLISCGGLDKMAKEPVPVTWSVNPSPLQLHADRVAVQINVRFPAAYFDKKAVLVVRPVLRWEGGEKELKPFTLQGESVTDNNKVIPFATGGSYTYNDTLSYVDAMRISRLEVSVRASSADKSVDVPAGKFGKLADGVVTTPLLVKDGMMVDNGIGGFGKTMSFSSMLPGTSTKVYSADIQYALQQSNVRTEETKQEDLKSLLASVLMAKDANLVLQNIEISSYASPDGPYELNDGLSKNRGKSASDFVDGQFKKNKIEGYKDKITKTETAEDWAGFQTELDKSNIRDKELIRRVLSMYSDPIVREREIKNMSEAYTELKTAILPVLRRSKLNIKYEAKAFTSDEVISFAKSNPDALSQAELFFAGQNAANTEDKIAIYNTYISKYPSDWKAYNNLGNLYIEKADFAAAKTNLLKANEMQPNTGSVLNNLGVIAMGEKDYNKAYDYFKSAKGAGENSIEVNQNLGTLQIMKAEYNEAVSNFGGIKSFNAALAQLMSGDAAAAASTIAEVEKTKKDAAVYYLRAVIGARQNEVDVVYTNLRTAISKDEKWKNYAKNDMEFRLLFELPDFKALFQ